MGKRKQKARIQSVSSFSVNAQNFIGMYTDIVVRGMVSLLLIFYPIYWVTITRFGLPLWVYMPLVFLVAVFISPYLNKYINVGYKVQAYYNKILEKYT